MKYPQLQASILPQNRARTLGEISAFAPSHPCNRIREKKVGRHWWHHIEDEGALTPIE